jgi:hypothetical protein
MMSSIMAGLSLVWKSWTEGSRKLEGTLVRGKVSGEATLTIGDVDVPYTYKDALKRGYADDSGYLKFANGYEYEGALSMNKREGIQLFHDGGLYEGDWKADQANGYGRMRFASGGDYEGEWKEGWMNGQDRIVYASSGCSHQGLFEEGRPAGAKPRLRERPKRKYYLNDPLP